MRMINDDMRHWQEWARKQIRRERIIDQLIDAAILIVLLASILIVLHLA